MRNVRALAIGSGIFVVILLMGVAVFSFFASPWRDASFGDNSDSSSEGGFSLLVSPGELRFSSTKEESKTVLISVEPTSGFNDPVNLRVHSIAYQDDSEDMSASGIRAAFVPVTASPGVLASTEYAQGAPLIVSHDGTAKAGSYIALLGAKGGSSEKTFILPITIQ